MMETTNVSEYAGTASHFHTTTVPRKGALQYRFRVSVTQLAGGGYSQQRANLSTGSPFLRRLETPPASTRTHQAKPATRDRG